MINTGLLLRRPYESDYAAFRRFLVANQFETQAVLKAELEAFGERSAVMPGKPWIALKAREWEKKFCEANALPFQLPAPVDHRYPLRNCPVCAAQCYHTVLYQYPWAKRCPLHRQEIVTSCPSCKQPWPTPSELRKRECPCCSARLSLSHLSANTAFKEPIDTHFFDAVSQALDRHDLTSGTILHAQYAGENQYGKHTSPTPDDLGWPSLIANIEPAAKAAFEAFGAEILPISEKIYDIGSMGSKTGPNRSWETRWEQRLSRCFDAALREKLRHRFGPKAADGSDSFFFADRYSVAQIVYWCRINWRAIVNEGPRRRRHLPYVSGCELFMKPDYPMPLSPCFVTHVAEPIPTNPEFFTLCGEILPRQLPSQLQCWLYQCDLWWTFLAMLSYLDAVATGIMKGWSWDKILQEMQDKASPANWHRPRYFVSIRQPHQLSIQIPQRIANFDFDNLKLQIEGN